MDQIIKDWIVINWQRKLVALLIAITVWMYVSHSMTETKTFPGVTIKIVNLPTNKTINTLLPNGVLGRRVTLTLTGSKKIIENLESNGIEVVLDAANSSDEWVVQITKKNLVSLDPSIDLQHHITQVQHQEFIIELSELITAKIPVTISKPTGQAPEGYQFLGIWPQRLMQTVSGPAKQIKQLRATGLELSFDLRDVRKQVLDALSSGQEGFYEDEVSFSIPDTWKKVAIPFQQGTLHLLNDPDAKQLRMDFLRMQFIPIERLLPIRVYYPLYTLETLNQQTAPLATEGPIKKEFGVSVFTPPTLAYRVSRLFLDIVRDHMELTIVASLDPGKNGFPWSIEFNNSEELEKKYIAYLTGRHKLENSQSGSTYKKRVSIWKNRFRDYMQRLRLYTSHEEKLSLSNVLKDGAIRVE